MCGIVGFWSSRLNRENVSATVNAMAQQSGHRGPDDFGVWTSEFTSLALGHRRLSIVDLSAAGHQPMVSQDGRYALVLNGEIYNFNHHVFISY